MDTKLTKYVIGSDINKKTEIQNKKFKYLYPKIYSRIYNKDFRNNYYKNKFFLPLMINPNLYFIINSIVTSQANKTYYNLDFGIQFLKDDYNLKILLSFHYLKSLIIDYKENCDNINFKKRIKINIKEDLKKINLKYGIKYKNILGCYLKANENDLFIYNYIKNKKYLKNIKIIHYLQTNYYFNTLKYGIRLNLLKDNIKTEFIIENKFSMTFINYFKITKNFYVGISLRTFNNEISYNLEIKIYYLELSLLLKSYLKSLKYYEIIILLLTQSAINKGLNFVFEKIKKIFKKKNNKNKLVNYNELIEFNNLLKIKNKNKIENNNLKIIKGYLFSKNIKIDVTHYLNNLIYKNQLILLKGDKSDYFFSKNLNKVFKKIYIEYEIKGNLNKNILERNIYENIIIN